MPSISYPFLFKDEEIIRLKETLEKTSLKLKTEKQAKDALQSTVHNLETEVSGHKRRLLDII